jgi:hypothetical protein
MGTHVFETIRRQLPDGSKEKKTIYNLSEAEAEKLAVIGTASGPSLGFCIYLGFKHADNFFTRVYGYRISTGGLASMTDEAQKKAGLNKPKSMNVKFYEIPYQ